MIKKCPKNIAYLLDKAGIGLGDFPAMKNFLSAKTNVLQTGLALSRACFKKLVPTQSPRGRGW